MTVKPNISLRLLSVMTMVALAACAPGGAANSADAVQVAPSVHPESGLRVVPLSITSQSKTHKFRVEVASTGQEQAQGLMFRTKIGPDEGMIFPFKPARPASFWMKNTVIPLDLIFIRADGSIESIAANAVPYSLDPIQSGEPVAAVLEIAGGRAKELGLMPNDKVVWGR